jgi:uncharacterized caspase-like protein
MNSWSRRDALRAALAAGGVALLPRAAAAQQKVSALLRAPRRALVIGNSAYRVSPLKNPANDARAMSDALKAMGFEVTLALDLPRDAMLAAAREYTDSLAKAKPVGLFYYAGHGMQLAWRNYLLPVDATVGSMDEVRGRCLDVNTVIEGIARAANPMNLIVLDACRENPFGRDFRVEQKGLSQLDAPAGTFLAYATSPGNVASDGAGANGLYTENLLREMRVPEAKIEDVFKRVRLGVRRTSNGAQVPWESTSLEDDFWFIPPKELKRLSDAEVEREFKEERAAWEKADAAADAALLEAYLKRYPSGRYSEVAQANLDALLARQGEKRIEVVSSPANPYSQGYARADTAYQVGDSYTYNMLDLYSKVVQETHTLEVGRLTPLEVFFRNGVITDRIGNPRRVRGVRLSGSQVCPAEFQLGRQWSTRYEGENPQVGRIVFELSMRVAAREKVTVPAGTFDAFRVDGEGVRYGGKMPHQIKSRMWFAPEKVRRFVLREEVRTAGRFTQMAERQELVAFRQA